MANKYVPVKQIHFTEICNNVIYFSAETYHTIGIFFWSHSWLAKLQK